MAVFALIDFGIQKTNGGTRRSTHLLAAYSLCRAKGRHTMCEMGIQIGNSAHACLE
jgi:hypothetical protein